MKALRSYLVLAAIFAAVWAVVCWPQPQVLATKAYPHQDVYFNMWRLEWLAHASIHQPLHLLDGNMFYPETRTLTYSDAVLVEGAFAAPFIWLGFPPVLVQNLMIFGAMIASACAMFALVRYLTGSTGGAVLAGIAFGFAPYRFEHVMHLELQWAMWSPLAFLFLHRTFETGRIKYGLLTGLMIALQMLSSIYYGVYLSTLVGLGAVLFIIAILTTSWILGIFGLVVLGIAAWLTTIFRGA